LWSGRIQQELASPVEHLHHKVHFGEPGEAAYL